jgi:hypothetical protein
MKPLILDNILDKKELDCLLNLLDKMNGEPEKYFEKSRFDRYSIHRPLQLISIAKRLKPTIEDILNIKLALNIAMISCYKKEGRCPPHFDTEENEFGLAICVKKNANWPFFVDDCPFNVEENEAILFNGYRSEHYREGSLGENDFLCVAFLHFRRESNE